MDKIEELKKQISLIHSKANGYDRIEKFFEENEYIQPYYKETIEECRRAQCFGKATMMILTIEKLLDKIDGLE